VGGKEPVSINVRVVATTNVELEQAVEEGKFREDLFYRLNVIPLKIPPLRERKEDIPLLVEHFVNKHSLRCNKETPQVSPEVLTVLKNYEWRGNVRELENVIERTILLHRDEVLLPEHLLIMEKVSGKEKGSISEGSSSMKKMEKELILKTLEELGGNRTHAARSLGISIRTLRNKLSDYRREGGVQT
jgi:two-component system response regulator FlrC